MQLWKLGKLQSCNMGITILLLTLQFFQSWTLSFFFNFVPPNCKVFYIYSFSKLEYEMIIYVNTSFRSVLFFGYLVLCVSFLGSAGLYKGERSWWKKNLKTWSSVVQVLSKVATLSDLYFRTFFYEQCSVIDRLE